MRTPPQTTLTLGHRAPTRDREAVEALAGSGSAAYGELCADSAATALAWLRLTPQDELLDLGSGTGKLVTQAALETRVGLARGVELSRFRHRVARQAWARQLKSLPADTAHAVRGRVKLEWGDLRAAEVSRTTVLYAGSTCFPDQLLRAVGERACAASNLRVVLSTRELHSQWRARLPELGRLRVRTTWDPHAWLFAYGPAGS